MSTRVSRPANRRQFILASGAAVSLAGCSFRRPYDGEAIDLKGYNLNPDDEDGLDMAMPQDQAIPRDLATPRDQATPQDLAGNPDLAGNRDFATPDLATRDLATPDLTTPDLATPDLANPPPDLACGGDVRVTTMLPVGGAQIIQDRTLIMIARDAGGYMAMEARCSHAGCAVRINSGAGTYDCPCHGSRFSLNGSVLQGPAVTPMRHLAMCRDGQTLVVDQFTFIPGVNQRVT